MIWSKSSSSSLSRGDAVFVAGLRALAGLAGVIVLVIVAFLTIESAPVLRSVGLTRFFSDASWHPTEQLYNLMPMIAGTLAVTIGAVALATPLGILSAIFCHFYAGVRVAYVYRRIVEMLAGIPSVVYGFWGLMVLVPAINEWHPPGASLLAGTLVVAVMILPTIALMADATFASVPRHYLTAAHGLGLDTLGVLRTAVLPASKSGLATGVILQTGRALGETMAVIMVCGNVVQWPTSVFDPIRTLTANIALEMAYAVGDHRAALFASGLILALMIVALVWLADLVQVRGDAHV